MPTLIFATHNPNKVNEIRALLDPAWTIISLDEAGIQEEIPEPHDTLEANASEKSSTIYRLTGKDCFSEDTGLETEALKGEPGVRSARYAAGSGSSEANMEKLLRELKGHEIRKARFRTVISLVLGGQEHQFEGICNGNIAESARGNLGFGYDPVFVPDGDSRTFAEMTMTEKNRFSHRKKALEKLMTFLNAHIHSTQTP